MLSLKAASVGFLGIQWMPLAEDVEDVPVADPDPLAMILPVLILLAWDNNRQAYTWIHRLLHSADI
jgi:hypothetical protein